jgi:prepilin-type N-terminal cleavage/methylation domain-containing protein
MQNERRVSGNQTGFTLVEVSVVLILLALMGALAVPALRRWVQEDELTEATRRFELLFQLARDSAIATGKPITVWLDSASSSVWLTGATVDSVQAGRMPVRHAGQLAVLPGEPLELPSTVHIELTRARAQFRFSPSGAVFADSLILRTPMVARLITLHPWTGDVVY